LVYGQAVETMFALLVAFGQVPGFILGWLMAYKNPELRSAVTKIHKGTELRSALEARPTWKSLSVAVHEFVDEAHRERVSGAFAELWRRTAEEFASESFEPEYNSLKHGMRSQVGGFSVAIGEEKAHGEPPSTPESMASIGRSEYGSTFWMPMERIAGTRHTFQLTRYTSRAWIPDQFGYSLHLIAMSVRNLVSRSMVASDPHSKVQFEWPSEMGTFEAPMAHRRLVARNLHQDRQDASPFVSRLWTRVATDSGIRSVR
jgi:hypothetical protein